MRLKTLAKKEIVVYGIGAGVGITAPYILKKYVDPMVTTTNTWLKPSTIIPLATGVLSIFISRYTKLIKKKNQKNFLIMYGITTGLTGLLSGLADAGYIAGARASLSGCPSCEQKAQYQVARNQGGHTQNTMIQTLPSRFSPDYYTSQYYPNFQGNFLNRPQTMARGWGSDVTRNPMAAIPTTIPRNGNVIRA